VRELSHLNLLEDEHGNGNPSKKFLGNYIRA
jgi:hypothetical protein